MTAIAPLAAVPHLKAFGAALAAANATTARRYLGAVTAFARWCTAQGLARVIDADLTQATQFFAAACAPVCCTCAPKTPSAAAPSASRSSPN